MNRAAEPSLNGPAAFLFFLGLHQDGKGGKDRRTMLPQSLIPVLQVHLNHVKRVHEKDLDDGWGRVILPGALERKYPNASTGWRWQWVSLKKIAGKTERLEKKGDTTQTSL